MSTVPIYIFVQKMKSVSSFLLKKKKKKLIGSFDYHYKKSWHYGQTVKLLSWVLWFADYRFAMGHTNHRNTGILPKYRNTREKYRYTYKRRLLKTPILALINQFSNIMST